MGADASDVVEELLEAAPELGGTELPVLIRAVGNLLPYRESGIPELEKTLTPLILTAYSSASGEAQQSVLMTADRTLARFGLNADTPVEELQRGLDDNNSYVRELAAELLGHRGADSKSALTALDEAAGNFRHPEVPVSGDRTVDYSGEVQRSAANAVLAIATNEVLEMVGLVRRAKHRPYELSGGEQQRISIARSVAMMPDLILADEPTGELDSVNAGAIFGLFRQMADEQDMTVVATTHDRTLLDLADEIYEIADGVLSLRESKFRPGGEELFKRPEDRQPAKPSSATDRR